MEIKDITEEWIGKQKFEYSKEMIEGVLVKDLKEIIDGRGSVMELWSLPWTNEGFVVPKHSYMSATDFGVTKCWHLHEKHIDQFTVSRGKLQVCLADLREGSKTFGKANSIILGKGQPRLIKIPPGVMHGWKALSQPEVLVINYQSEIYDPRDEFKFRWDSALKDLWEPKNG